MDQLPMTCQNCGLQVPMGQFCTRCGAHQGIAGAVGARRSHRYAANPDESVYYPGLFSSIFPHLDSEQLNGYRTAFAVGLVIVGGLFAVGLTTSALLAGATLLPLLGAIFLIEQRPAPAEVRRLLVTAVAGPIALGMLAAVGATMLSLAVSPFRGPADLDPGGIVVWGIAVPIAIEVAKAALALSLRGRPNMGQTIDGVVLGAVIGLMLSFGAALVVFARTVPTVGIVLDDEQSIFPILSTTIFLPFLHAASTAAIAGALWRGRLADGGAAIAIVLAVAGHVALIVGTSILLAAGRSPFIVLGWQGVVVAGELILIRWLVHRSLLEETAGVEIVATTCPNCRLRVQAASFCSNCGLALSAVQPPRRAGGPRVEEGIAGG
jgi:hypothetical protein